MAVIYEFKDFLKTVTKPHWTPPGPWHWLTEEGEQQGIAPLAEQPGIFNLAWIALGKVGIPTTYNLRGNDLLIWVLVEASRFRHCGVTLEAYAATHTMAQFAQTESNHPRVQLLIDIAKARSEV